MSDNHTPGSRRLCVQLLPHFWCFPFLWAPSLSGFLQDLHLPPVSLYLSVFEEWREEVRSSDSLWQLQLPICDVLQHSRSSAPAGKDCYSNQEQSPHVTAVSSRPWAGKHMIGYAVAWQARTHGTELPGFWKPSTDTENTGKETQASKLPLGCGNERFDGGYLPI